MAENVREPIQQENAKSAKEKRVSVVCDMVTDKFQPRSFFYITFFWIDCSDEWQLLHCTYKSEHFPQQHTENNILFSFDANLEEVGCDTADAPITTNLGSDILFATRAKTRAGCAGHRLNNVINEAWKKIIEKNPEIHKTDQHVYEIVAYVRHPHCIQEFLPYTLKQGGITRPWRRLSGMFHSVNENVDSLKEALLKNQSE